jgi:hypothetical protein
VRGVRDRRNGIHYLIEAERLGELAGSRAPVRYPRSSPPGPSGSAGNLLR